MSQMLSQCLKNFVTEQSGKHTTLFREEDRKVICHMHVWPTEYTALFTKFQKHAVWDKLGIHFIPVQKNEIPPLSQCTLPKLPLPRTLMKEKLSIPIRVPGGRDVRREGDFLPDGLVSWPLLDWAGRLRVLFGRRWVWSFASGELEMDDVLLTLDLTELPCNTTPKKNTRFQLLMEILGSQRLKCLSWLLKKTRFPLLMEISRNRWIIGSAFQGFYRLDEVINGIVCV